MKDYFYLGSRKPVTSALCVGVVSLTALAETGFLLLPADVKREFDAMVHTNHSTAPMEPTTNSAESAAGTLTVTTFELGLGLTFNLCTDTWKATRR
jgi:hypothetical protein